MAPSTFQQQPFGKYLLTERIGAGGMAEIFRATAFGVEGFTKELCIKRILPTLTTDDTFVRMFIHEAKIAVNLHHANIVQVFDLGRIGEHYFIAMELVRGKDLLELINGCRMEKRRMPVHIALSILASVCQGLDFAHRVKVDGRPLGLIHRDVSPSNILVSWEGEVKVADFGIAKAAQRDEKTVTGTLKGKYGYLSPEQVKGNTIDKRSDIFAAGILLYECLVGRRLFKGATDLETLELVREAKVAKPPSAINKEVSPEIDALALKALALDADQRFQSAGAMYDAIAEQILHTSKRSDSTVLGGFVQALYPEEYKREEMRAQSESTTPLPGQLPNDNQAPVSPMGPPTPQALRPTTRPDLPALVSTPPRQGGLPPLAIGLIGTLGILLVAVIVALVAWLSFEPPPIEREAQVVSVRRGTLELGSKPTGAKVVLNGEDTGFQTPATLRGLDPKQMHTIELDLAGHEPWRKQVDFGPMDMVAIDAQLEAKKPDKPKPIAKKKRRKHRRRRNTGVLNVNAIPWAYVYIDGKKMHKPTPLVGIRLKAGPHTVRLVNPKLGLKATRQVHIKPGKKMNLVVDLK